MLYISRVQGLNLASFRACAGIGLFSSRTEDKLSNCEYHGLTFDRGITSKTCQCTERIPNQFSIGSRCLSSQAGTKSGAEEEDNLEEGFSELETPEASETTGGGDENVDDTSGSLSYSDSDISNVEDSLETELLADADVDAELKASKKNVGTSPLLKLLLDEPLSSISGALDKYASEGKDLSRAEVYRAMLNLRRRKRFPKALQVLML